MDDLKKFITPLQLGKLCLSNNIFYGPMAGCSDYSFRGISAEYAPGLVYTEMVKMDALVRGDAGTFRILDYGKRPVAAQMVGSKPHLAKQSAHILRDLGFDLIDLNCGCPVDKVTMDGSGSGLLKEPEKIGEILSQMKEGAGDIPITVKIRAGWDDQNIQTAKICKIAEEAGACAITIHGRTREQGYAGTANWDWILEAKKVAKKIKVIGNGDITSPQKALSIFSQTGCDAILISRATLGKPWIVSEILAAMEGRDFIVTPQEIKSALLRHFAYVLSYRDTKKAILEMRKIGCWYLKELPGAKPLRESINKQKSLDEFAHIIESFPWNELDLFCKQL